MTWLLVAIGGAVGAPCRYLVDTVVSRRAGTRFPLGTLLVNVLGAALLGGLAARLGHGGAAYAGLGVGFCGAFTTFSTFAWEAFALVEDGEGVRSAAYVAASLVLGIGVASATYWSLS
jgi:CrcB protein